MTTSTQPEFYVGGTAPVPGKTTFTIVADTDRASTKLVMGYVVEVPGQDRQYLNSQGEDAPEPHFRDQLDAAVDHYKAWAAKHS